MGRKEDDGRHRNGGMKRKHPHSSHKGREEIPRDGACAPSPAPISLPRPAMLLVLLLEAFPVLSSELPGLLRSLDEGNYVDVGALPDPELRERLGSFLHALDVQSPDGERPLQFKAQPTASPLVAAVCALMDGHGLAKPPKALNASEMLEQAKQSVEVMAAQNGMQDIWGELPDVLERVLTGELVVLDGLPAAVHQFMKDVLSSLGLKEREEDDVKGMGLSSASVNAPDVGKDDPARVATQTLLDLCIQKSHALTPPQPETRGSIGPARPDASQLALAAALPMSHEDSNSSDSEFGPSVAGKERKRAGLSPRSKERARERHQRDELRRAVEWDKVKGKDSGAAQALADAEAPRGREEWMMVPPKSLGVLGALKTLQPTARTFQAKSARGRRAAADGDGNLPAEFKSKEQKQMEAEAEELMAAHRAMRGPSLADAHMGKSKEQRKRERIERDKREAQRVGPEGGGEAPRKVSKRSGGFGGSDWNWSRDDDIEQRKRITPQQYAEMLANSKQLDSKFSREVSRNFM